MKLLKKALFINWHYMSFQTIEFEGSNFLTGKNAAGKSTIIDGIQLLLLGNPRGNFYNKAATDKAGRSLEGYLKGEIGDDGDVGYKYLREGRFTSYIVCEFFDTYTRKNFCLGVVFDVYTGDIEYQFFYTNGKIPENNFIQDKTPMSIRDLKSFLAREYSNSNFEMYSSNKQYQNALLGRLGAINSKFFSLFKKAVTFTPIDDIEKFIVDYICDVKNKIDITSMQENIRHYNSLAKQVEIMKERQELLVEIDKLHNKYIEEKLKEDMQNYLILRGEKQVYQDKLNDLNIKVEQNKKQKHDEEESKITMQKEVEQLEIEINKLEKERANSDIARRVEDIKKNIQDLADRIKELERIESHNINLFRNNTLKWNAYIEKLEKVKHKVTADEISKINDLKDLITYLENVKEEELLRLDISSVEDTKNLLDSFRELGNNAYFKLKTELEKDENTKQDLEKDISKLERGTNPYKADLLLFKAQLEEKLSKQLKENVKVNILADLLEIRDVKWQNAIEGYLSSQKEYLLIEPKYFEIAGKIYKELAKQNSRFHSFGLVDIQKIQSENKEIRKKQFSRRNNSGK